MGSSSSLFAYLLVGELGGLLKGEPGALTSQDKTSSKRDTAYTGYYLITNLSHKINPKTHYITMNVIKDSFSATEYKKAKQ